MRWSDLPLSPSPRTLRQFAGLWIGFFGLAAVWYGVYRDLPVVGLVLGVLAGTVGPLGLVWPRAVRPIYVGWMIVVFPIGWLVSLFSLSLLYYTLITPLGLFFRVVGRDILCLSRRHNQSTYWVAKPKVTDPKGYYRAF